MNEPRFPKVDWAIRYAYIAEATKGRSGVLNLYFTKDAQDLDDFQLFMKRLKDGLTKQEVITDGIMLKNTIMRYLDDKMGIIGRCVIGARYRIPNDETLRELKLLDYELLAGKMKAINKHLARKWFVVDMIRGQMEGTHRMHHTIEDWARLIGVSDKTLYRYAGSNEPNYKSIKYLIKIWEMQALSFIETKLYEDGQLI